jgi:hypothetical protein
VGIAFEFEPEISFNFKLVKERTLVVEAPVNENWFALVWQRPAEKMRSIEQLRQLLFPGPEQVWHSELHCKHEFESR